MDSGVDGVWVKLRGKTSYKLSTPCNGFLGGLSWRRGLGLKLSFQLHVMDSYEVKIEVKNGMTVVTFNSM